VTCRMDAVLPWLHLPGVPTGNRQEVRVPLLGPEAADLSAAVVARLKNHCGGAGFCCGSKLVNERYVVCRCAASTRGCKPRTSACATCGGHRRERAGAKKLLAPEDEVSESKQCWREVRLGFKRRAAAIPPGLAMGNGALGFGAALGENYPQTRQQNAGVHKTVKVLNYLPKFLQPKAKAALHEIWMAETKAQAPVAFEQFVAAFGAGYSNAVECLVKDREAMLAIYELSAEPWSHIRTSNAIESTFATIRHSTERTKGFLMRDGKLSMIFKLGMSAGKHKRRLRLRGFQWLAKLIAGARFRDGIEVQQRVRKAGNQAPRGIAT
jgi:putative transposase